MGWASDRPEYLSRPSRRRAVGWRLERRRARQGGDLPRGTVGNGLQRQRAMGWTGGRGSVLLSGTGGGHGVDRGLEWRWSGQGWDFPCGVVGIGLQRQWAVGWATGRSVLL